MRYIDRFFTGARFDKLRRAVCVTSDHRFPSRVPSQRCRHSCRFRCRCVVFGFTESLQRWLRSGNNGERRTWGKNNGEVSTISIATCIRWNDTPVRRAGRFDEGMQWSSVVVSMVRNWDDKKRWSDNYTCFRDVYGGLSLSMTLVAGTCLQWQFEMY